MEYPEKLDLHMHSTVSDGTDAPEALISRVKEAGIGLFALTDHDAVKGCLRIQETLTASDPAFLPGIEFSCRDEEGRYHILGYGYDPTAEPMAAVVEKGHALRMKKVHARLEFLENTFGFRFPAEEVRALLALDNPGKPHIGNLMVKYGYAKTKEEAIRDYIDKLRVRSEYVHPREAIEGILGGGGIPVLAHPVYGSGDQLILGEDMDRRLRRLMGFGLRGVEAYYSGFTKKLTEQMLDFARKYDLLVTAGSDYHGSNKLVALGDSGLPEREAWSAGLLRFLDEARWR